MDDLYTDNDPDYRNARVRSGIPPPVYRDKYRFQQHQQRNNADLSRYNPAMQRNQPRHRQDPYKPYPNSSEEIHGYRQDNRHEQQQRRDSRHDQRHDSRYEQDQRRDPRYEQGQRQQQQNRVLEPPRPTIKIDFRANTDFLSCEKPLPLTQLIQCIQLHTIESKEEDFFIMPGMVEKMNRLKEKIRHVPREQLSAARSRSNPFERIGNSIFMNRAATKLAALDATFGLSVTSQNNPLLFADLCGGPGGFTEYLLWRVHSWGGSAQGYGMTLKAPKEKDELNWHIEKFRQDIPPHFTQVDGPDKTGDIYKEENIRAFDAVIARNTQGEGVDLVVADGGFDFTGNEDKQEQLAQRLQLCEIITMLTCLKQGGHFVCKFFDILSEFTGDLVWLLYQLFDQVCITKPLTSRPANSERYIVCKGLRYIHPTELIETLLSLNSRLEQEQQEQAFLTRKLLEEDDDFMNYLKMRNMKFVLKQTEALEQLDKFMNNPSLSSSQDQEQVKRACLNEWRLPLTDPLY
ncbi:FtsJ-domain-containing protein [Backusella circina FSU 941]|nr:FtsJ-domain-containing protein [Backusella circina FSU 941]